MPNPVSFARSAFFALIACLLSDRSHASSGTTLSVDIGVPIPLAVYGYLGRSGDGGRLTFLGSAAMELFVPWSAGSLLGAGIWVSGTLIQGGDGDARAEIYFVSFGAGLHFEYAFGPKSTRDLIVGFTLGPSALASGILVDENLSLHTWSFGGRARLFLGTDVAPQMAIGLSTWLGIYGPPANEDEWFNRPLRGTRMLGFALTMSFSL